ncbi:hypothetical protein B0T10DRAFT_315985 [Thelonectria olida]|uniref:Uncharacterized protein n=1 Tax=Thelonectria olida TaxID=1576542 RepID=A0A9P9AQV4_9HYPO|nr:hypothetical protein B0T10DRAFT_315985 [Thelonectria olida]
MMISSCFLRSLASPGIAAVHKGLFPRLPTWSQPVEAFASPRCRVVAVAMATIPRFHVLALPDPPPSRYPCSFLTSSPPAGCYAQASRHLPALPTCVNGPERRVLMPGPCSLVPKLIDWTVDCGLQWATTCYSQLATVSMDCKWIEDVVASDCSRSPFSALSTPTLTPTFQRHRQQQ